jgi:hypothetical protein
VYETYKSATLLDNGILTVEASGVASYTKWVSLRHVATITEYKPLTSIGQLSLNIDNGDVVHIEGEQDLLDSIIDAWGVL